MQRQANPHLEQQLANISTTLNTYIGRQEKRECYQTQMQEIRGVRDLFQVCAAAASEGRDRNIEKIANGLMSGVMIYEGYAALSVVSATAATTAMTTTAVTTAATTTASAFSTFMSVAGPWAMVGAGALTLFQVLRHKKGRGDDGAAMNMIFEAFRALSQQISNMHQELHEFRQESYENQLLILRTLCEGFAKFETAMHQDFIDLCLPLANAVERIAANQTQWGRIHSSEHQELALQRYDNLLNRMLARLEHTETANHNAETDKLLGKACDMLKLEGTVTRPLYTGTQLLANRAANVDLNQWINEVALANLDHPAVVDRRAFLSAYAKEILGIQSINSTKLFNPTLWLSLAQVYLQLRHHSSDLAHDRKQVNLDRIIEAAEVNLAEIRLEKKDIRRFTTLFACYQNEVTKISKFIEDLFTKQNQWLNKEIKRVAPAPKVELDVTEDLDATLQKFKDVLPLHEVVVETKSYSCAHVVEWEGGGIATFRAFSGNTGNIKYHDSILRNDFMPEFVLLERLGLGKFQMRFWGDYKKPPGYIYNSFTNHSIGTVFNKEYDREITIEFAFANENTDYDKFEYLVTLQQSFDYSAKTSSQTEKYSANIDELRQKARHVLSHYFLNQRKLALQALLKDGAAIVCWQSLAHAINANVRLLLAMALDAGCKENEIDLLRQLWSSREVLAHVQGYIEKGTIDTALPHQTLVPDLNRIKTEFLKKLNSGSFYFANPLEAQLDFLINQFRLLKATEQSAWQHSDLEKMSDLVTQLREIFSHYEEDIFIWKAEKYRKAILADERASPIYRKLVERIEVTNTLILKLNQVMENIRSENILVIVRDLLKLNDLCIHMHKALLELSPIYKHENSFKYLTSDRDQLQQLEKQLSTSNNRSLMAEEVRLFTNMMAGAWNRGADHSEVNDQTKRFN